MTAAPAGASPHHGIPPPGRRLPAGTRPGAVRLQVGDLERSRRFYEQVIGLREMDVSSQHVALAAHGDHRVLVVLQERPGARAVPRRGRFGLFHFAILLPDRPALGRAAAHLARHGAIHGMADHRVSEALYLSDPDGLGIEIYADRPRDSWTYRGRELVMTTEPLDLDDAIAAGAGVPWTGAPAGTTIGHVHLHVGDLEEAERFYHVTLGLDKTTWSYPGALFLAAGGYHHHLGTNTWSPGPSPAADEAQLLEWELLVPDEVTASVAARALEAAGYATSPASAGWVAADPWGTRVRIAAAPPVQEP
jgi:catechol 2,3-dioxygenase